MNIWYNNLLSFRVEMKDTGLNLSHIDKIKISKFKNYIIYIYEYKKLVETLVKLLWQSKNFRWQISPHPMFSFFSCQELLIGI